MNIKTLFTALIAVSTIAFVVPATYAKTPRRSSEVRDNLHYLMLVDSEILSDK